MYFKNFDRPGSLINLKILAVRESLRAGGGSSLNFLTFHALTIAAIAMSCDLFANDGEAARRNVIGGTHDPERIRVS
jgi:hypothetical protein